MPSFEGASIDGFVEWLPSAIQAICQSETDPRKMHFCTFSGHE